MLDNTLIYGTTELSNPVAHVHTDYHVVLMGHAGGKLPGNMHFRPEGRKLTELVLTLMQVMGVQRESFGSWDNTSQTMPEIFR